MRKKLRLLGLMLGLFAFVQTQTVQAQSGSVLNLPGTSGISSMTIPSLSSAITAYPFTIEMWVKPNAITTYGGFFYDKGTKKTSLQFANATTGEMRFDLFGTSNAITLSSAKKLAVGKWQHLAVSVTADSIFVEIDSTIYAGKHTTAFAALSTGGPTLGLDVDVAARTFNGLIDNVRIWKSARTRDQILTYRDSALVPSAQPDLVACYSFNDSTAHDATANALNGTISAGANYANLNSDARIGNLTNTAGFLTPAFNADSLSYSFYAPYGASLTAIPLTAATISNSTFSPTVTVLNDTMITTSKDALNTKSYKIATSFMPVSSWDADGKTGAGSEPYFWGWGCSNLANTAAFGQTGGSNCRYNDVTNTSWFYTTDGGTTKTVWQGRDLYVRWDGTGGTNLNSIFSYPFYLEAYKTYEFSTKYTWVNNSTVPTLTLGIGPDKLGTTTIASSSFPCSATKQLFQKKTIIVHPTGSGVYYLTVKGNTASIAGLADMDMVESTTPMITKNVSSLAFTDVAKSAKLYIAGNLLTDTIKLSAPAGVILNKKYIPASETNHGDTITASIDYSTAITSGKIYLTSGTLTDSIPFTYTGPTVSIYEQATEVENNGTTYPLTVLSVNNTIDSLYITPSAGLKVNKTAYGVADFVSGALTVSVSSTAAAGTTGTLVFSSKAAANYLDTVNVTVVAPYTRYYIKHKASGLVIGNHSSKLYPALTTAKDLNAQRFILRRTNPSSTTDTTYYLMQDTAYRAMRKIASSGWDTEFGVTSNEAKWTFQQKGSGIITLTNAVTNKVLGADALTADSRMYDDKSWVSGNNTEWMLMLIPKLNSSKSSVSSLTANVGQKDSATIKISGSNLAGDIAATISGANADQFTVKPSTIASTTGTVTDTTLTITYTPTAEGTHSAILTLSSPYAGNVAVKLTGTTTGVLQGDTVSQGNILYKITGSNLIANPGFEEGLSAWTNGVNAALSAAKFAIVDTGGINNSKYLVGTANTGIGGDGSIKTIFPVEKGKKYLLNYYVKYQDATLPDGSEPYLKASTTDTYGTETNVLIASSKVGGKGVWTRNAVAFIAQNNYLQIAFRWLGPNRYGFDAFTLNTVDSLGLDFSTLDAAIVNAETYVALNYPGLTALNTAIDAAKAAKSTITAVGDIDVAITALNKAIKIYKLSQSVNATSAQPLDVTFAVTNPSFEDGTTNGWTYTSGTGDVGAKPISNATYTMNPIDGNYLFNIWAGKTMDFFVQQEITDLPNGFYTLTACVGSDKGNTIKLFANTQELPVAASDSGNIYAVYDTLVNVFVGNHTLVIGAKSSTWFKVDNFRLTYVPSINYTSAIVNPTIEATGGNVVPQGWTINKGNGNTYTNTGQHWSGVTTNRYLDSWNGTVGSMIYHAEQLVDSIPNGVYSLKSAARSSGSKAYIFANGKSTEIINNADQGGALGKGWNYTTVDSVVVMDNTILIGAETVTGWTGTWFSADDFSLQYFGEGTAAMYKPYLDSLIVKAKKFDLTTSPDGVDAVLTASITAAESATDILPAYATLKKAYNDAVNSVAPNAKFKALINEATALAGSTAYTGLATFNSAITAANVVYNGTTTLTADVVTATTTLKKAMFFYQITKPASVNAPADFNFAIENRSFETGTLDGWNISLGSGDVGSKLNSNSTYTMAPCDGNYVFNIWGGTTLPFFVEQTITDLPNGYYTMSALCASDASNTVTLYANGTEKACATSASGKNVAVRDSVSKFNITDGQLILGARSQTWFKADDFRLIYFGSELVGLNDPKAEIIVYSHDNRIFVQGASQYEIYGVNGIRYEKNVPLQKGIYIVKTEGKTYRVAIK